MGKVRDGVKGRRMIVSLCISPMQSSTLLRERTSALNKMAPQCPVNLLTLHFREGKLVPSYETEDKMRDPWMYQECGHVFGQHQWKGGVGEVGGATRSCPMCRKVGVTCIGNHGNKA